MKLRRSLRNSARRALLSNYLLLTLILICGCSSSTTPTYSHNDIASAVQNICSKEYSMQVKAKLVGETLWVYIPIQGLVEKADGTEKFVEKFEIKNNESELAGGLLKVNYNIKPIPEKEKPQEYQYNKEVLEKVNNAWKVLRRVIFSMERGGPNEPKFFCVITADVDNGYVLKETFYYVDLKKVMYQFISFTEYQHRDIQGIDIMTELVGDWEGINLPYRDITFEDFIASQIAHRIKLKFQRPEVDTSADIDKEIMKIIVSTLKIYDFKDFYEVQLNNLVTQNKTTLNQMAVWARPAD